MSTCVPDSVIRFVNPSKRPLPLGSGLHDEQVRTVENLCCEKVIPLTTSEISLAAHTHPALKSLPLRTGEYASRCLLRGLY